MNVRLSGQTRALDPAPSLLPIASSMHRVASLYLTLAVLFAPSLAWADEQPAFHLVVSQRLWTANWDQAVNDLRLTGDVGPRGLPVARAGYLKNVSSKSLPISALGLRHGRWSFSVSHFGDQDFDGNGIYADADVRRRETDLALGYQLLPGLSLALIRKTGKTSSNQTRETTGLLGTDLPADGEATLLGLSASAPLTDHWSLYGNAAWGPGRFTDPTGLFQPVKSRYAVSEFGLAFRHGLERRRLGLSAVTFQAGYRVQAIAYRGFLDSDFEGLPLDVEVTRTKARSVTDGAVFSMSLVF